MPGKKKKKYSSGLIIRLIDVVLILLFGFIAISEVSKKSRIKLAESAAVPATAPDREQVVYIGVLPDGRYLVNEERAVIDDEAVLQRFILAERQRLNAKRIRMRVRVRANYDAPVKYAFRVVNLCRQMKIPAGLDVVRKNRG